VTSNGRARETALRAHKALFNGSGTLSFFEARGIRAEVVRDAWIGYDATSGTFTYPSIGKSCGLLGIHYKSERRDKKGKRRQWWGEHADHLPPKGHGKRPEDQARVIPFGLETLWSLDPGSPVVLCCGEEDTLSLRQAGYVSVSQPGAGLLEPAYAKELAGLEVVVFYDAGEAKEAYEDALKLIEAGAKNVRVVEWPKDALHGCDVNHKLVVDPEGFERWLEEMIKAAKPPAAALATNSAGRERT
jgi:hypothetical protein